MANRPTTLAVPLLAAALLSACGDWPPAIGAPPPGGEAETTGYPSFLTDEEMARRSGTPGADDPETDGRNLETRADALDARAAGLRARPLD